jgi:hypothetical protein
MKSVKKHCSLLILLALWHFAAAQTATAQNGLTPADQKIVDDFEKRSKDYSNMRESLETELPKLPKDATPEQIEAHKAAFMKAVQNSRRAAKHGEIFTPDAARVIRAIIAGEYRGKDRAELRKMVMDAEVKTVPLKINFPYPEETEQLEMPPALLLKLPQLPKQLRYRFVGQNLLLVDRENGLIVDYMSNALP